MKKVTIAQQLKITEFPFSIEDKNGNEIYYENSRGSWIKREYDSNGKRISFEDSNGYWLKNEYDSNGNRIYFENSDGYWSKNEYDSNGKEIYYENSVHGIIRDDRPNVSEVHITMADIKDSIYKVASADIIISIQRTTPVDKIELTMDEIAKKFGINVNLLTIKK